MKNYIILFFILLLTIFVSCNKASDEIDWKEAYVINDGSPAYDGCGWVISIQNIKYEPKENLDSEFLVDSLKILVDYKLTGNNGMNCWASLKQISIENIKKN